MTAPGAETKTAAPKESVFVIDLVEYSGPRRCLVFGSVRVLWVPSPGLLLLNEVHTPKAFLDDASTDAVRCVDVPELSVGED